MGGRFMLVTCQGGTAIGKPHSNLQNKYYIAAVRTTYNNFNSHYFSQQVLLLFESDAILWQSIDIIEFTTKIIKVDISFIYLYLSITNILSKWYRRAYVILFSANTDTFCDRQQKSSQKSMDGVSSIKRSE